MEDFAITIFDLLDMYERGYEVVIENGDIVGFVKDGNNYELI